VSSTQTATTIKTLIITAITKAVTYALVITVLIITARKDPKAATTIAEVVATTHSIIRSALCARSRAAS
jgi:hypothetical protein